MERPTSEQILRTFGRNVEVLAAQKGILLRELAERIQVTPGVLARARYRSTRFVDVEILLGCAEVLGCTADTLLKPIDGVMY